MRGAAVEIGSRSRELRRRRTGEDEEELASNFSTAFQLSRLSSPLLFTGKSVSLRNPV